MNSIEMRPPKPLTQLLTHYGMFMNIPYVHNFSFFKKMLAQRKLRDSWDSVLLEEAGRIIAVLANCNGLVCCGG